MELVEPHVVVTHRPALLVEIDPEHEHRVDELCIAKVVASEFVLRPHWVNPGRARTGGPAREGHADDLPREAALDELRARWSPTVELGVVKRALLEPGSLGADLAKVRAVELARRECAPRPRDEERRELLVEAEAAKVARDEVGDGEVEFVEAGLPEVDVREPGAPHRDDAGLNVVPLRCAVLLGHFAPASAVLRERASAPSASRAPCRSRRGSCRSPRGARP